MYDAVRVFSFAEAIGGVDEGKSGLEGGLLVFFRVSDINAFCISVALHDETDVLALGKAGASPLLVINEKIGSTGGGKEGFRKDHTAKGED